MTDLPTTQRILAELLGFPTVSADSNLDMMAYMAGVLETAGARVSLFPDASGRKANLWATLGPERDGGIVLSGHSDVVPVADQAWSVEPFGYTEREARIYGRGACDMKGFIAATLAMSGNWSDLNLARPIHFAFTYDEEVGCLGAQALVPELQARGLKPAIAIVGEPTSMKIVEAHKGCCEYTTRFSGLEGHGSVPEAGVNAVGYAVQYAGRLMQIAEDLKGRVPSDSPFCPPWSTINIGALHGGVAHNVIPGKATLEWEMRPVVWDDADYVKATITAYADNVLLPKMRTVHPDADISTEIVGEVVGLEHMPQNAARALVAALTGRDGSEVVSFGTEAGLFQQMGMSVVVCGPGDIAQAHKPDEFVSLDQLAACLKLLDGLGQSCAA